MAPVNHTSRLNITSTGPFYPISYSGATAIYGRVATGYVGLGKYGKLIGGYCGDANFTFDVGTGVDLTGGGFIDNLGSITGGGGGGGMSINGYNGSVGIDIADSGALSNDGAIAGGTGGHGGTSCGGQGGISAIVGTGIFSLNTGTMRAALAAKTTMATAVTRLAGPVAPDFKSARMIPWLEPAPVN